ncbi:MAG: MFS transporter [Leptolyngbyaceae bacterium]|nr:MFS transporter [Leptolyngbyaceae bacterium]
MTSLKTKLAQKLTAEPSVSVPHRSLKLLVLVAAGCLTTMTGTVIAPIFPEMMQQLQLEPAWAATLGISIHEIAIALFTPMMGLLADRIGKLKIMLPGLVCYAIFGIAGSIMPNLLTLLVDRALLGLASASIAAASIGLLGTLYHGSERTRMLGYATSAMTTASITTLFLGGWVGTVHWQFSFYLYALSLPVAFLAATFLQEGQSQGQSLMSAEQGKQLKTVLTNPDIIRQYLTIALSATIMYTVIVYAPIYLKQALDATPALRGTVLGLRAIGVVVASALLASRFARRWGTDRAIAIGFLTMALTLATIPLMSQLHWIIIMAMGFGVGFGIVVPNTYDGLSKLASPTLQATVLAAGTGVSALGKFLCPLLFSPVREWMGLESVFYVAAAIALLIAITLGLFPREAGTR